MALLEFQHIFSSLLWLAIGIMTRREVTRLFFNIEITGSWGTIQHIMQALKSEALVGRYREGWLQLPHCDYLVSCLCCIWNGKYYPSQRMGRAGFLLQ